MPKAIWNDKVIADAEQTEVVEGNHYFPPDSLSEQYFEKSDTVTRAVHGFIESRGFHWELSCDSRCWLEWRPASDGPTSIQ